MSMSEKELADKDEFKKFFRGVKTHQVAMAMTRLVGGIDFGGCSKDHLAEVWAWRNSPLGHRRVALLTLEQIKQKVLELYQL